VIFIIRQPLNAYPSLGNVVDGTLATNKFSFIFSGDKLASYKISVKDAYTNASVYTGSTVPKVLYNGDIFEFAMPSDSFANSRDLIWSARLTQASADMKVSSGTLRQTSTTATLKVVPNIGIKVGMKVEISGQTNRTITAYINYSSIFMSTLGPGSTYDIIKVAGGQSNFLGNTLMIGSQKRSIVAYNAATAEATVLPSFSLAYPPGTGYSVIDEKVGYAIVTPAYGTAPVAGTSYSITSAFIDTINYFFKSRLTPTLIVNSVFEGLTLGEPSSSTIPIMTGLDMFGVVPYTYEGALYIPDYPNSEEDGGYPCTEYNATTGIFTSSSYSFSSVPQGTMYIVYAGMSSTVDSRIGNFKGTYNQAQSVGIKYHVFNLYDESGILLDTTGEVYNGDLTYSYDAFLSGQDYSLKLTVVTQENVTIETEDNTFTANYSSPDFEFPPSVKNIPEETGVEVEWTLDKIATPVTTGTWEIIEDFPFAGTNSVEIGTGELIYDNISNTPFDMSFFTVFSAITFPITKNGYIINLADAPASGSLGELGIYIENFKIYQKIVGTDEDDSETELIAGTIPRAFLLTASGTPTAGTGYVWDDSSTWDDTKIWTETVTTDAISLKATIIASEITVTEVSY